MMYKHITQQKQHRAPIQQLRLKTRPVASIDQNTPGLLFHRYLGALRVHRLTVNRPGDAYEQEAERIAERVMRMPVSAQDACRPAQDGPAQDQLQRKCACEEDELQRKASGEYIDNAPSVVGQVLGSAGQPLDASTRAFFEPRFGHDFSHVRVHTGADAAASAQAVQARAYTAGSHVVFGEDEYSPHSWEGRQILAHELAHVVQQTRQGGGERSPKRLQCMPATSDCTATDISEITAAYPVAQAMVSKAYRVIGATPTPAVDALLGKYFNDDSVSTRLHTLIGYNNLISGMASSFSLECEHAGNFMYDWFCEGSNAYVRAALGFAGNVHLCEAAFGRSVNDLAETIIHECSHKFDNTDDEAYCWGGCPASLGRWDAYDNADSFSKFAWEAYTTIP